ncbi:MAG: acyl-CoA thioesterase [Bdellovibrionales bacterium]
MAFRKQVKIYFDQGDPARIVFHGQHSIIVQRVLEDFIPEIGIPWEDYFDNKDIFMPLVRLNHEFKKPLYPGETYNVEIQIQHIGRSSLKFEYQILDLKDACCCVIESVYVCTNPKNFKSKPLPEKWVELLKKHKQ